MKYNNDSVLFYSMLVQPIQPGEAKKETMPEHHSAPHFFPDFPEDLDEDLIVCVETMYQGDADHSNDADCITIHHEEPADDNGDTTSVAERHQNSDDIYIRSAGNRLLISGFEQPENLKISIYTISGSLVTELRGTASELENSASTHKLKTGIYLVQLQSESGVMYTEKLFFK